MPTPTSTSNRTTESRAAHASRVEPAGLEPADVEPAGVEPENGGDPFAALPTETEIYILPGGEIVIADLPAELTHLAAHLAAHIADHLPANNAGAGENTLAGETSCPL